MPLEGFSNVAAPPQTPTLPQNPIPVSFSGFSGLNTKASQQGIEDQQMFVCDGLMPLGENNLRSLYGLGAAIYTAPLGKTIKSFNFNNIGATPYCIVCLSDGSLVAVNMNTFAASTIAAAGTITSFPPDFNQWGSQYVIIVSAQMNGYFLWDGINIYKAGTLSPQVDILDGGSNYTSSPTITTASGTQASGDILFAANPSPGDTITLNGVVITFVAGSPVGNQVQIAPFLTLTIGLNLINFLNGTTNPALTVASYTPVNVGPNVQLNIVYNSGGPGGNSYTLAASAATPSGPSLTGGTGGGGIGATFSGTVQNGVLTAITVSNPGHGYVLSDIPVLTITGGGSDDMASATANVSATSVGVQAISVIAGGHGYTSSAYAFVSDATGTGAQLSLIGNNGVVTGVNVLNPGFGYSLSAVAKVSDTGSTPGSGASLHTQLAKGQVIGATVVTSGTNYITPPTLTVIGDGTGAQAIATIGLGGQVSAIQIINPGLGYTAAQIQFQGGNNAASATASIMPFGVSGTTCETYQSRVWVGNGHVGQVSAPGSPSDFTAGDGSAAFTNTNSFQQYSYIQFSQSNGFLYLFSDSSLDYVSGVQTAGNPAVTTFNNLNVDPQIGTPWHGTVQEFGRDLVFANPVGVHVSYGGAVTKVSDALDGIYTSVPQPNWPAGFSPSAAVANIFGIKVYILTMPILDQVTGQQVIKLLMWDGKRWWTSPQEGLTVPFIATQKVNSQLTTYCSATGAAIAPMFAALKEDLMRYLYSKLWDAPGVFTTKMMRQIHGLLNVNYLDPAGANASGSIVFNSNPVNNQVVTLNGYTFTFVAGAPGLNQVQIGPSTAITIGLNLLPLLQGSTDPRLSVATYSVAGGPSVVALDIAYDLPGSVGNNYTLAGTGAITPSGATLSGGADGPYIWVAAVTENGIGAEVQLTMTKTGPATFGPVPVVQKGKLMGVRFRTSMADIQLNSITLIDQVQQSDV